MAPTPPSTALLDRLHDLAMTYPEVVEGTSCNRRAYTARKKNFLFLSEKGGVAVVMLKLGPSLPAAEAYAAETPGACDVGKLGWVTLRLGPGTSPPDDLAGWIDESFRLLAPKTLVKALDAANA